MFEFTQEDGLFKSNKVLAMIVEKCVIQLIATQTQQINMIRNKKKVIKYLQ